MMHDTAPDAPARDFRAAADTCLRGLGLAPARLAEMREELLSHLEERFHAELALGRDAALAARRALSAFGDPERIRRRLLLTATLESCREALRIPWTVLVIVLADVGVAAMRFVLYAEVYFADAFLFRRHVIVAIPTALLQALVAVVLARFGLLALRRRFRFHAGTSDLVLGAAAIAAALSYWIVQRPGLFSMALSDVAQALPYWWPVWQSLGSVGWVALILAVTLRCIELLPWRALLTHGGDRRR